MAAYFFFRKHSQIPGRVGGGGIFLPYLGVLGMCRWAGCLFELPALAQGVFFELPTLGTRLACILLIFQAIISQIQPNNNRNSLKML